MALIGLSTGANDLTALIVNSACAEDPLPPACPLESTLEAVTPQLDELLISLRERYPDAPIVVLAYPNIFSGSGLPIIEVSAGHVLAGFADALRDVAARHDGVYVASPSFEGRGVELSHVKDAQFDPHPNDAGHAVIAEAVLDALEEP